MSYSKDLNRTDQDLKFLDAQDRLRRTLHVRKPKRVVIHGPGKRSAEETARLIADLEAKIGIKPPNR